MLIIKTRKSQLVIKPATGVLFISVIAGIAAPQFFNKSLSLPELAWDCVNPTTWKFEIKKSANAQIVSEKDSFKALTTISDTASFHLDTTKGIDVRVLETEGDPASVYLRNGLNFDSLKTEKNLAIEFSARTDHPRSLIFILREGAEQRWTARVDTQASWKVYQLPISFQNCQTSQAILAIHMGAETGLVSLKDVRIVSTEPKE